MSSDDRARARHMGPALGCRELSRVSQLQPSQGRRNEAESQGGGVSGERRRAVDQTQHAESTSDVATNRLHLTRQTRAQGWTSSRDAAGLVEGRRLGSIPCRSSSVYSMPRTERMIVRYVRGRFTCGCCWPCRASSAGRIPSPLLHRWSVEKKTVAVAETGQQQWLYDSRRTTIY